MRAVAVLCVLGLASCDDATKSATSTPVSASVERGADAAAAPTGDGCTRSGSLEAIENDPACVVTRVSDEWMRDLDKRVSFAIASDDPTVVGGSGATLRLTITNRAPTPTLVVFDAFVHVPGPRPDWSRLAGVPEVKPPPADTPRLHFAITTLDASHHDVDGMPSVAGGATPAPARVLAVKLKPGAKLTRALSWWALRIPAPLPIVKDDAGHRFVPQTLAIPLTEGDYTISVEVPLHGVSTQERTITTEVHVDPAPKVKKPKRPKPEPEASGEIAAPEAAPAALPPANVLRPPVP